jgi:acetyltransferase AlgX (SGNH hydrolase-like protein)
MRPRIGYLIPCTIALALAIDAGTRLIPIDLFAFRAWEALIVAHAPTGPFEPDRVYANPLTYGDLARAPRYAALRQHHFEYFSTDAWGFRNTPQAAAGPVRWLLIGDSFGVSSGVRDADTLASQLARWSGERTYNASSYLPLPVNDIRFTSERVGAQGGLVIYEYMERQFLPGAGAGVDMRVFTSGPPRPARSAGERLRVLGKEATVSRLGILAGWGRDAIAARLGSPSLDGGASQPGELPTAGAELANGATMLFFTGDVEVTRDPAREIPPDYLIWLRDELRKAHLELAVLIAPTKYQVYGPLVRTPGAPRPSDAPLRRLADALNARGVFAVDVTDALRRQAAADLARHEYVYFLDDTHWNERGIETAARTFVDARRRAGRTGRHSSDGDRRARLARVDRASTMNRADR